MRAGSDITVLYREFADALTEVLAENAVGPARRGRLARARAAVKHHPEYSESGYLRRSADQHVVQVYKICYERAIPFLCKARLKRRRVVMRRKAGGSNDGCQLTKVGSEFTMRKGQALTA